MDPHDPPCGSLSDTESVRSVPQQRRSRPRRRLRLTWQVEQGADTAHRDVRAASQLVEALARRVGCIPDGAPLPRAIQQQRCSPFNVPLMWSAAWTSATTLIVEWMVGASRGLTRSCCRCRVDCVEGSVPWMGHHGSGRSHHEALSRRIPSVFSW